MRVRMVLEMPEPSRGTGPRATIKKRRLYRRARACPSPRYAAQSPAAGFGDA